MKITGIIQSDALIVTASNGNRVLDFNLYISNSDATSDDLPGYEEGTLHRCSYWKLSTAPMIVIGSKVNLSAYMAVNVDCHRNDENIGRLVLMVNTIVFYLTI
jgi:hypothetical protein